MTNPASDGMEASAATAEAAEKTTAWKQDGAGGDVTEIVPHIPQTETELAWSADNAVPEPEPYRQPWTRALLIAAAILVPLAAVAAIIAVPRWMSHHDSAAPSMAPVNPNWTPPSSVAPPPQPSLTGTYQIVFDVSAATYRGNVVPPKRTGTKTSWWAWRSSCPAPGCTASSVKLDDTNHTVASARNVTDSLNYINGQWMEIPVSIPPDPPAPGCTESTQWVLRPQPDGTLAGTETETLEGTCGSQGNTTVTPFVATRIGPVPDGLLRDVN